MVIIIFPFSQLNKYKTGRLILNELHCLLQWSWKIQSLCMITRVMNLVTRFLKLPDFATCTLPDTTVDRIPTVLTTIICLLCTAATLDIICWIPGTQSCTAARRIGLELVQSVSDALKFPNCNESDKGLDWISAHKTVIAIC